MAALEEVDIPKFFSYVGWDKQVDPDLAKALIKEPDDDGDDDDDDGDDKVEKTFANTALEFFKVTSNLLQSTSSQT